MRRTSPLLWFLFAEIAVSFALAGTFTITGVYFVKEAYGRALRREPQPFPAAAAGSTR